MCEPCGCWSHAEVIKAADVLEDINRLPFIGYELDVQHDEATEIMSAAVKLSTGGQAEHILHVFSCPVTPDDVSEASRKLPLIESVLDFLNAGGDPEYLTELMSSMQALPRVEPRDFQFLHVLDEVRDRDVFYRDAQQRIVRVVPGAFAEIISGEEFARIQNADIEEFDDDLIADSGSQVQPGEGVSTPG